MKYEILGEGLPVVVCHLDAGEGMINESGSMSWMSPNMKMETTGGGAGKMLGRLFSGENLMQNRYTAQGGEGLIAFASSFPGNIVAVEITPSTPIIAQKSAFLAGSVGIDLSTHFNKKLGGSVFGGEGFIMQKIAGSGIAFLEIDGQAVEYTLAPGQSMLVSTGCLAMMEASCTMDIQAVPGVKNMLFGGEGLFNTVVTGPGKITLQSMPLCGVADVLRPFFPSNSN